MSSETSASPDKGKAPRQRYRRPNKPKSSSDNSNDQKNASSLETTNLGSDQKTGSDQKPAVDAKPQNALPKSSNQHSNDPTSDQEPVNATNHAISKTTPESGSEPLPDLDNLSISETPDGHDGAKGKSNNKNNRNRRPRFTKKKTQRRMQLDELMESDKLKVFQIEPELYQLLLMPSDPEFPYPIPVLSFDLHLSRHYPNQGLPPRITVNNEEIPKGNSANIETGFNEYGGTLMERIDLLDKNLEALLTKPAAKVITIVKTTKPQPAKNQSSNQVSKKNESVTLANEDGPSSAQAAGVDKQPTADEAKDRKKLEEPEDEEIGENADENANERQNESENENDDDDSSGPDEPDIFGTAWESHSNSSSSSDEDEIEEYAHSSDEEDIDSGAGAESASKNDPGRPKREGTELVFSNIEIVNMALLEILSLNILFQCGRCKASHTFSNLQSAEYGRPTKPRAELCGKCDLPLMVAFRKEYLHSMCHTAGYLDVEGGKAIDLLPSTYQGMCQSCQNYAPPFKNMDLGAQRMVACRHCHAKLWLKVESFDFVLLSTESLASAAKKAERAKLGPAAPKQKLHLMGGEPLPLYGTCQHYRRSTRWFRFACCQRVFACDQCHDLEMQHPCDLATRMVCGYCSREQRFSQKCHYCEHDYTQRVSRFWEGGKGVRDKRLMSRKDKRKYKRDAAEKTKKAVHFQGKSKAVKHS